MGPVVVVQGSLSAAPALPSHWSRSVLARQNTLMRNCRATRSGRLLRPTRTGGSRSIIGHEAGCVLVRGHTPAMPPEEHSSGTAQKREGALAALTYVGLSGPETCGAAGFGVF